MVTICGDTGPTRQSKKSKCNSALVLPDHYHPVNHTRCWWAPTRRTNVRSASLVQVQCKVCLSLLWIVQILSLYKKRLSQGITKKMTAPGVSPRAGRVAATRPRTFITPHTPGTPPEKEISSRRRPRCCTHEPESPGLYACLRPRLRHQGRMTSWSKYMCVHALGRLV